jgi:hypothetical protein
MSLSLGPPVRCGESTAVAEKQPKLIHSNLIDIYPSNSRTCTPRDWYTLSFTSSAQFLNDVKMELLLVTVMVVYNHRYYSYRPYLLKKLRVCSPIANGLCNYVARPCSLRYRARRSRNTRIRS